MAQRPFSVEEKIREIEREIRFRNRVYRRLVENEKMRQDVADMRIAIMTDILADYRAMLPTQTTLEL